MKTLLLPITFLFLFLCALISAWYAAESYALPDVIMQYQIALNCMLLGGVGGLIYCLRGIYLSFCVRKDWESLWIPWYFIRPVNSCITGGLSYIFFQAGLLILESDQSNGASNYGFYALAFIAGYNVDKFLKKLEDIAAAVWGVESSRAKDQ